MMVPFSFASRGKKVDSRQKQQQLEQLEERGEKQKRGADFITNVIAVTKTADTCSRVFPPSRCSRKADESVWVVCSRPW